MLIFIQIKNSMSLNHLNIVYYHIVGNRDSLLRDNMSYVSPSIYINKR